MNFAKTVFFQDNKWYDLFKISGEFVIKVDIDISGMGLKELPNLSEVKCLGKFDCSNNDLVNLKGSPKEVSFFNCSYNKNLNNLEGGPKKAHVYECYGTCLQDIQGHPDFCKVFVADIQYLANSKDRKFRLVCEFYKGKLK